MRKTNWKKLLICIFPLGVLSFLSACAEGKTPTSTLNSPRYLSGDIMALYQQLYKPPDFPQFGRMILSGPSYA